jgi:hypothetical protein
MIRDWIFRGKISCFVITAIKAPINCAVWHFSRPNVTFIAVSQFHPERNLLLSEKYLSYLCIQSFLLNVGHEHALTREFEKNLI